MRYKESWDRRDPFSMLENLFDRIFGMRIDDAEVAMPVAV